MLDRLRKHRPAQLAIGLLAGVCFGFLLQKGGATRYDVILGQLLLTDFTVLKIMLSTVVVGMAGVYVLRAHGLVRLHPKPGSVGMSVVGGLVFGVGFAVLGYCPGTIAGAVGQGNYDALAAGVVGMLIGAWIFSEIYPRVRETVWPVGWFGEATLPGLLKRPAWMVAPALSAGILLLFLLLELAGY
jgi:hypothetical protein